MEPQKQSCEYFELLISAASDGEISRDESTELAGHIDRCSSCRQRRQNFDAVSRALLGDFAGDFKTEDAAVSRLMLAGKTGINQQRQSKHKWVVLASLAAAVTITAVLLNLNIDQNERDGRRVDLATPVVRLTEITTQRLHDQEMLRESLELDVRTLKLQTQTLDDDRAEEILDRIELLLERIEQAKIL